MDEYWTKTVLKNARQHQLDRICIALSFTSTPINVSLALDLVYYVLLYVTGGMD